VEKSISSVRLVRGDLIKV
jgi:sodium/potassium-transporting ATPase subunit alpha